jgi:hypothetical protein
MSKNEDWQHVAKVIKYFLADVDHEMEVDSESAIPAVPPQHLQVRQAHLAWSKCGSYCLTILWTKPFRQRVQQKVKLVKEARRRENVQQLTVTVRYVKRK